MVDKVLEGNFKCWQQRLYYFHDSFYADEGMYTLLMENWY